MKIRKAVLVVFMLSFLVSYSDAGFLCNREKNEIYQCRAEQANANANCNAKLMKINAEKEEKMKENTKCNDTLIFWKGMGIGGALGAVVVGCIELVHKLLR
jgi:hypothetical protein